MVRLSVVALVALALASSSSAAVSPSRLLARYEPVTVLHPDERFRTVRVDAFLSAAALEQRDASGAWTIVDPHPATLPTAEAPGCASPPCLRLRDARCSASVGVASLDCFAGGPAAHAAPAVYGAVFVRGHRIALQYWLWYAYDFWSAAYPFSDDVWNAHEGDWELVTVLLTRGGTPLLAGYSQHTCGKRRAWSRVPKTGGTHPLVYVALSSHANYFTPGAHPIDLRPQCYPALGAALLRAYVGTPVEQTGAGPRLRPPIVQVTAASPQWMQFPGAWGEANYFHAPPSVGTRIAGAAPLGPVFHAAWRDPIGTVLGWPAG